MFKQHNLIIILFLILICSGCTNQIEIDRVSFPVAIGLDFDENKGIIQVYAQIASSSVETTGTKQESKDFKVVTGIGSTLLQALDDTIDKSSKNISWKHVAAIIISKNMAQHGIVAQLDSLLRFSEFRLNSYIMMTDEHILDLLQSRSKFESPLSTPLAAIKLTNEKSSNIRVITIREFIMDYLSDGKQPILPRIKFINDKNNELSIDYVGLCAFKDDKYAGSVDEYNTQGLNLMFSIKTTNNISVPYHSNNSDQKISLSALKTESKIMPYLVNDSPEIKIKVLCGYNIGENSINDNLNEQNINKINIEVEKYIAQNIDSTVNFAQKQLSSDILGFGEKIYRKYPKYWNEKKDHWNEIFPKVKVSIEVTANLENLGQIQNSIESANRKD